jgi:hypothetical protein
MISVIWAVVSLAGGEIFGDIKAGDSYVDDAAVTVTCGTEVVTAKTDSAGSFRIRTKATGKCKFAVAWKEQSPSVDVVVFDRPTRYRLVLEEKDGKYTLRRV